MSLIPAQRHLFDIPGDVAYLNCAYLGPQLNASRDRLLAAARAKSHPWERDAANFFDDAETIRRLCAGTFGGDADGYAVVPAVSYAMSAAARAVEPQLRPGDRIVAMAEEFPSNVLPWMRVAQETGAEFSSVSAPRDGDWTQALLGAIDRNVKVVAASPCHWTNGARIDLAAVARACRAAGAVLAVDASQGLGAMPLSISEIEPDFLAAAGYKWLLCPYGFSVFYVAERWRGARPLEECWLAREKAEDFAGLVRYSPAYMAGARRFDSGEKCTALLPGAIAALEQVRAWGVESIAATLARTNATIAGRLEQLGFRLPAAAQRCPHMFGAELPDAARGNLVAELKRQGIHVSQRGNALRISPHLHVSAHDVQRLGDALEEWQRAAA